MELQGSLLITCTSHPPPDTMDCTVKCHPVPQVSQRHTGRTDPQFIVVSLIKGTFILLHLRFQIKTLSVQTSKCGFALFRHSTLLSWCSLETLVFACKNLKFIAHIIHNHVSRSLQMNGGKTRCCYRRCCRGCACRHLSGGAWSASHQPFPFHFSKDGEQLTKAISDT